MIVEHLLTRIGVLPYLRRRWRDDLHRSSDKVEARFGKRMAAMAARVEALDRAVQALTRREQYLRTALLFDAEHRERRHGADVFDEGRVARHVAGAIGGTNLDLDPMAHMVIDGLLPRETYDALVDAIPPVEFFSDKDERKQNFKLRSVDVAPEWTMTALGFVEDCLIPRMMVPGLVRMFETHIRGKYVSKYGETLGAQVAALPHIATAGRLMLRRPGYHLDPHLDPDRVVVTCLIYFARPGDDESFGTSFYRIDGNPVIDQRNTFYPREAGYRCELVKTAPFRANSAVAFVNARGAHGADIPKSAPAGTERYAYQFYVSPEPAALAALIPSAGGSLE